MGEEATPTRQQKLQNFLDGARADPETVATAAVLAGVAQAEKAQRFFAELAASIVTPHVGDQYRDTIKSILLRATEAGLYAPEPK